MRVKLIHTYIYIYTRWALLNLTPCLQNIMNRFCNIYVNINRLVKEGEVIYRQKL